MDRFRHMRDNPSYPGVDNIDVNRYRNEFDYSRWNANVRIRATKVPWCGDYENVVKFENDEERDSWLDSLRGQSIEFDTMFHNLPEQSIKLPVPVQEMQQYNYLIIDLPIYTSEGEPVNYAGWSEKTRYLYFIDNVSYRAANTTECIIRLDYWTTYINDLNFTYAVLERGHLPVSEVTTDEYLANPRGLSTNLLAQDVSFGDIRRVRKNAVKSFNAGETFAVFVFAADQSGDWGGAGAPKVPGIDYCTSQGVFAPRAMAVDASQAMGFVKACRLNTPQWFLTVRGVFFISKDCVSIAASVTFNGYAIHMLDSRQRVEGLLKLDKRMFGYPKQAERFAKLYTYPYAEISVTDSTGSDTRIRIEDTEGSIDFGYAVNLIMPWIGVNVHLLNIGGVSEDMQFSNLDGRTYTYGGLFSDTFKRLDIPVFALTLSADANAYVTSDYTRAQAKYAADTALTSAVASADTGLANTNNSATNTVTNNAISVAANSSLTNSAVDFSNEGTTQSNNYVRAGTNMDNYVTTANYNAEMDGLALAASNNNLQSGANVVSSIAAGVTSVASGNIGGVFSAIGSAVNTGVNWATTNSSIAMSQSNSTTIYNATINAANEKTNSAIINATLANGTQNSANQTSTSINNNTSTAITNNNASLMRKNASNSRNTSVSNANRSHDVSIAGIAANLAQQGVNDVIEFGASNSGIGGATEPVAMFARVMTQPDGAIMQAATLFARYGYTLNTQVNIQKLQVMKHFTYWKLADVWCSGNGNAVEGAQQAIKDIMVRGVTVWSRPEEIGGVDIYAN